MSVLYTIPQLSRATGIGEGTLRAWKERHWLRPFAYAGVRPYYRMEDFETAAAQSSAAQLKTLADALEPVVDTLENDQSYYAEIAKKHAATINADNDAAKQRRSGSRKEGRKV